ncbi:MAG: cupredoxin domain-containing protein [Gammaproteobacteria bacterium]
MKTLLIGLIMLGIVESASAMNHGGMVMNDKGMIMNANSDNLPRDCTKISENVDITVHAGQKHALKFTGLMFAFDQQEWDVKPCAKINITFINDDQIRHQLMIHGLPGYLYPEGMFHLELYGEGKLQASLIMPSQKKTYLVHCEVPQHMEKGMKAQIKVDGGDGDLPSIPGISAPVRADVYPVDWNRLSIAVLLLCVLAGCAIPYFVMINAQGINNKLQKTLAKLNLKRKKELLKATTKNDDN